MSDLTKEQQLFQMMVNAYDHTARWTGTYAHGLFDAFVLMTGEDPDVVNERLYEAVLGDRQRSHEEYLDSLGVQ